ncbi:MAG: hypothetical protein K2P44_09875, partial [Lachnospiraceae bacterium]|nr:hypothetical protein [Lachnospiraceae bacterium]
EVAQLARAHGSYPWCRGFESPLRYFLWNQTKNFKKSGGEIPRPIFMRSSMQRKYAAEAAHGARGV